MSVVFDPAQDLIYLTAHIIGPRGIREATLCLDTGATLTTIDDGVLIAAGYELTPPIRRARMTTGSDVFEVPIIQVATLRALEQERSGMEVVAHTLPPSAGVQGVLGLDFLRGTCLTIDFRAGLITLA